MVSKNIRPILFSYFRSSASWRVRTALAYKRIDYEYRPVNLMKSSQHSQEYVQLNPSRQVPTLIIDSNIITQSLPIIEYIEETRPDRNLLPKDAAKRAKARQIAEIINSGIQPIQNVSVLKRVNELVGENKKQEWAVHFIQQGFKALEEVLRGSAGRYCVGDDVTIADLCLVPQVYNAIKFNVDLSSFTTICRINEACLSQDFFRSAAPDAQPDYPVAEQIK